MSSRERKVCAHARKVIKLMKWANRTGGAGTVSIMQQDTGFLSWLRRTGEAAGDLGLWLGRNALKAWGLYQEYRRLTGQPTMPVPSLPDSIGQLSGFSGQRTGGFWGESGSFGGPATGFAGNGFTPGRRPGTPSQPPPDDSGRRTRSGTRSPLPTGGDQERRTRTGKSSRELIIDRGEFRGRPVDVRGDRLFGTRSSGLARTVT